MVKNLQSIAPITILGSIALLSPERVCGCDWAAHFLEIINNVGQDLIFGLILQFLYASVVPKQQRQTTLTGSRALPTCFQS